MLLSGLILIKAGMWLSSLVRLAYHTQSFTVLFIGKVVEDLQQIRQR
jgi:hypothetical protein